MRCKLRLLLLGLAQVTLLSCGYFKDDPKQRAMDLELVGNLSVKCIDGLNDNFNDYFKTGDRDAELSDRLNCLDEGIDLFKKFVRGNSEGKLSNNELHQFLDRFVFKEKALSQSAMKSLLHLKAALVGGSEEFLTAQDIERIRRLIKDLKGPISALSPYMDIYSGNGTFTRQRNSDVDRFDKAGVTLVQTVQSILKNLTYHDRAPLELKRLAPLFGHFGDLETEENYTKWLPLFENLSMIFFEKNNASVEPAMVRELFQLGSRVFMIYRRYTYHFEGRSILDPEVHGQLIQSANEAVQILESAVQKRSTKTIPLSEWQDLLLSLRSLDIVPEKLSDETLLEIWKGPILRRLLLIESHGMAAPSPEIEGFDTRHLISLKRMIRDWREGQRVVETVFLGKEPLQHEQVQNRLAQLSISPDPLLSEQAALFAKTLGAPLPMVWRDSMTLVVNNPERGTWVHADDLTRLNLFQLAGMFITKAYSHQFDRVGMDRYLSAEDAQAFFVDIRRIGTEMQFLDPRMVNGGSRAFTEADLFAPISDGNNQVTYDEVTHYLILMASVHEVMTQKYEGLAEACGDGEHDLLGGTKVPMDCTSDYFRRNFHQLLSHLPEFVERMGPLTTDPVQWDALFSSLSRAARPIGTYDDKFASGDVRVIFSILQASEGLLATYDRTPLGVLDYDEVWAAYPRFHNYISTMGGSIAKQEWLVKSVFSFLVMNGRPPSPAEVVWWQVRRQTIKESITSLGLLDVFGSIAYHGVSRRVDAIKSFYKKNRKNLPKILSDLPAEPVNELYDIYNCESDYRNHFSQFLYSHREELLSVYKPESSDDENFMWNMNRLIDRDPVLQVQCHPI